MARPKKLKHEIECPYCNKTMGKQGIYGHIRGNHKGMEDDYRARFPPKMTSLKPNIKKDPDPDPDPDPEPELKEENIVEEIMPKEEIKEKEESQPVIKVLKEELKPEPVVKEGEKAPSKKGSSFLDWLFGEDENKPGISKSDKKDSDDDDWW